MSSVFKLILWIIGVEFVGALSGVLTQSSIASWYAVLNHSPLTPPNAVFGVVWSILYAMIATSGWLLWQDNNVNLSKAKALFIAQLLLNLSWTPVFFYFHQTGLALIILSLLIVTVFLFIKSALSLKKWSGVLFIPYLVWLLLAWHLNYFIWLNN